MLLYKVMKKSLFYIFDKLKIQKVYSLFLVFFVFNVLKTFSRENFIKLTSYSVYSIVSIFAIVCIFSFSSFDISLAQECDKASLAADEQCIDTYTLLEPIASGSEIITEYDVQADGLSSYISDTARYFFMLLAIVSAFYLIYGGIQYLTTDMSNLKQEGKGTIKRVIIGLVFIFSIWTIFNAINPELLNSKVNFADIVAGIESAREVPGAVAITSPTSASTAKGPCQKSSTVLGITICDTIKTDLENMIKAAEASGITLRLSSGLRDPQKQIQLRTQNCGSSEYDIYKKPSGQCSPPTAIPGTSNHEGGNAVDFSRMCYSKSPSRASCTDVGYKWLMNNASKYNFKNNTPEPWHWSTTGY